MQVVFKTNLGLTDAKKLGLDPKKCHKGMTLDVSPEVAEALKKIVVTPEEAKHDELIQSALGVSKADFEKAQVKGVAKKAEIEAVPKPETFASNPHEHAHKKDK